MRRRRAQTAMKLAVLALALAPLACSTQQAPASQRGGVTEIELTSVPDGLSGLARDDRGDLWAIAERSRQMVRLDLGNLGREQTIEIRGVPELVELESLAFLPNGDAMIGTETDAVRGDDALLLGRASAASSRSKRSSGPRGSSLASATASTVTNQRSLSAVTTQWWLPKPTGA